VSLKRRLIMAVFFKFPLKMHVGAPDVAIVKEGQEVKRGECIAEPNGLGAKIHTSVTGKVSKITETEIIIEADDKQTEDYEKIKECDNIIDAVYEAGVVGAGGAGFPTHVKLKAQIPDGYIIANCVECEPVLRHNIEMAEKHPELMIQGVKYAMKATGAPKAYIGIKAKHPEAIEAVKKCLAGDSSIEVKALRDIYPMGEERALIHEIFEIWLEPTQLPLEAKCVVLNAETLVNIARAVDERKPVIDKDITVIGKLKTGKKPNVFLNVPVGTEIKSLIEKAGGIDGVYGELIVGGPYTGKAESIDTAAVTKTTGGAIVTIELPEFKGDLGLLVCACGANEARLRDVASKMKANVVSVTNCKNIVEIKGALKCKTPGE
jgi:proline reductase-associated electron transfer protein PrdC